jgi:hypothetical protein
MSGFVACVSGGTGVARNAPCTRIEASRRGRTKIRQGEEVLGGAGSRIFAVADTESGAKGLSWVVIA